MNNIKMAVRSALIYQIFLGGLTFGMEENINQADTSNSNYEKNTKHTSPEGISVAYQRIHQMEDLDNLPVYTNNLFNKNEEKDEYIFQDDVVSTLK